MESSPGSSQVSVTESVVEVARRFAGTAGGVEMACGGGASWTVMSALMVICRALPAPNRLPPDAPMHMLYVSCVGAEFMVRTPPDMVKFALLAHPAPSTRE